METEPSASRELLENLIVDEFRILTERAYQVSADIGELVETALTAGSQEPLTVEAATSLLTQVVKALRNGATVRADTQTPAAFRGDLARFIADLVAARESLTVRRPPQQQRINLVEHNSIVPRPVLPTPTFHEREVPVREGFVRTSDIKLWAQNARIDIHLAQFQRKHGRVPAAEEVLDIMLSRMDLPGVGKDDQFKIPELARSIAVNGVQKSPIIDVDGTLLDGNRRVAACYYILHSGGDEFDSEAKKRAEWILVWQLTEHATDDDREAVIVSLNFESDHKQEWPKYVKARKVYEDWQAMLAREPRASTKRQAAMKRELSKKFALGPDAAQVNLFVKMVDLANEFEDYQVADRKKDQFEVKHRAERYFEYFDELGKGTRPGGVNHALNQDESFKHLVYDLLYDGKFSNWNKIRELRYIADNEEALAHLRKARVEDDVELAQDVVDEAIGIARTKRAETRQLGANTRIESFVKWLEDLPVKAFRDQIEPTNLQRLHKALKLVEPHIVIESLAESEIGPPTEL